MNKHLFKLTISYSLIVFLSSCNSSSSKNSTLNQQKKLLTEFSASLKKEVTLNNLKPEPILLSADSINWTNELFFLSYLDQLSPTKFVINHTYSKDSTITKSSYTPLEDKNEIKELVIDFKNNKTTYSLKTHKENYLMTNNKSIQIVFKNYGGQKIVDSYRLKGSQKTSNSDSTFFEVTGNVIY